jgi:hypothetical protein
MNFTEERESERMEEIENGSFAVKQQPYIYINALLTCIISEILNSKYNGQVLRERSHARFRPAVTSPVIRSVWKLTLIDVNELSDKGDVEKGGKTVHKLFIIIWNKKLLVTHTYK